MLEGGSKLDLKDKRILLELDKDSRASFAEIAKKTGLSKEVVKYRVTNLKKNKFIEKFVTFANIPMLGLQYFKVYFRLANSTEEKEKQIIDYLASQKSVSWVASAIGKYDLIINVVAKDAEQFNNFRNNFSSKFGELIQAEDITVILNAKKFDRVYLVDKKTNDEPLRKPTRKTIDEKDKKLLACLSTNARMGLLELGKKAGCSAESARRRIKEMRKKGVIEKFFVKLNYPLIQYQYCKLMISFKNITEEKKDRFLAFCAAHPNIIYLIEGIGVSDIDLEIEVDNIKRFYEILRDIKNKFYDIIKDYNVLLIPTEHKFDLLAPLESL